MFFQALECEEKINFIEKLDLKDLLKDYNNNVDTLLASLANELAHFSADMPHDDIVQRFANIVKKFNISNQDLGEGLRYSTFINSLENYIRLCMHYGLVGRPITSRLFYNPNYLYAGSLDDLVRYFIAFSAIGNHPERIHQAALINKEYTRSLSRERQKIWKQDLENMIQTIQQSVLDYLTDYDNPYLGKLDKDVLLRLSKVDPQKIKENLRHIQSAVS